MKKTLLPPMAMVAALALGPAISPIHAQNADNDSDATDEMVFELSPFEVATSQDRGYYASNAISGSRINVPIQDMPLTIEVVTSEFIEDTGATDLRESLKYSSGILLQSQNDAYGTFDNFGNVNNPEGATGDKGDSSFKIRGFVVENTLRNGFRRQHATDTINIDRIEVIRGPSALLYGVGNFGGVVNYLPKKPLPDARQELGVTVGSDGLRRATVDSTTPLPIESLSYRLTMAYEERENHTDLFSHEHFFISPIVEWKPWQRTTLTFDFEYGEATDNAIGFRSVRTPTLEGIPIFQTDRLETYGFLEFEGKDPRTFRWSGPDTFLDTESLNANVQLQQGITENLNLMVGYNYSDVTFDSLDVFGGIAVDSGNSRAQPFLNTITARQIIDGRSTDVVVDVDNAVMQYNWNGANEENGWHQARAELNYSKRIFQGRDWLESEHNFLLGYSYEQLTRDVVVSRTTDSPDADNFMFKDPTDSSYIRFGVQADGSPDLPFEPVEVSGNVSENEGAYLVYSGRFMNDRLYVVAGIREDTSSSNDGYFGILGSRAGIQTFPDSEVTKQTTQFGISYEILDGLTAYALQSEGVEPNFDGQRDGNGVAIDSSVAESREFGIKINLWDGRFAASLSQFKIERDGLPFSYWWAPAPVRGQFRRNDDIIYRMEEWNLNVNTDNRYLLAAEAEWEAAKASGAVYEKESEDGRSVFTYLNASTDEGAAFLDKVFEALNAEFALPRDERTDNDPWAGWLFGGFDDPEVNTAAEDWSSGDFFQTISDQSEGYEAQFTLTPTDNFQIVLTYSHVEREIISPGNFVEYDYAEGNWDRWATWYFPNANWGLAGVPVEDVYPGGPQPGLPNRDTSTWTGVGWGKGEALDDTPSDVISWWASYTFNEDFLNGLQLGFGGQWESEREYASAFTTSGQRKQNETGETIKAETDARLTLNAMAKYSWNLQDRYDAYIQLNVDNLLDDDDQYGFIYAPGLSWKLNLGITF
jgi:outer membrane receptor protein involved in Fe transport